MANANYLRGVRWERQVMLDWEKRGYAVSRTAGSHSQFDVIGFRFDHPVAAIQCKCLKAGTRRQADTLIRKFKETPPMPPSAYFHQVIEVWAMKDRCHVTGTI